MLEHVYLIPLLPLFASVLILFFGHEGHHSKMPYLGVATMGWCLIQSCAILFPAIGGSIHLPYYATMNWFNFGEYTMSLGVLIDGPAAIMLVVVALVSFLVQVYSLGYMHDDPRLKRYYAYLSFFTASMLGLVVSSNLLVLFMCWELVGLSSYLLIGFWFEKPGPAYASKKAFITTKLGDLGFYLALLIIFAYRGTFDLTQLKESIAMGANFFPPHVATAAALALFLGAVGKSAQWPLFIWLPDAMEGPTPVSALIHAATMVAAGVYLVARTYFIYQAAPLAMETVAWIGLITAFLAASMALVTYDIKRVLAFSTVSQLGYMVMALGAGGYTAGLFHLTTHAFFKALLFLGAGSVIHAVHTNDMREMGGLKSKMPSTFLTMAIATASIAGFPYTSGFYSKEAILAAVYEHNPVMWAIALFTAGMTTFYMCRMMFLTFGGSARDPKKWNHAHESPAVMTFPLWLLAALALASGMLLEYRETFAALVPMPEIAGAAGEAARRAAEGAGHPWYLLGGAMAALVLGFSLAFKLYGGSDFKAAESLKARFQVFFNILDNRYGFDTFFLWLVDLSDMLAAACYWFDDKIVDKVFVDGWGLVTVLLAEIQNFFDNVFVDGAVDGVGGLSRLAGRGLRVMMDGQVQEYLLYVALTASAFAVVLRLLMQSAALPF